MERRKFVKSIGASSMLTIINPRGVFQTVNAKQNSLSYENLSNFFLNPPDYARTHTFWFWMNGNISKAGITKDLEAIKASGVGGVLNFDTGTGMIKGPVEFGSSEYWDLKNHAINECERLNLFFGMHNCPGWSSSGGPWVTPELSMLQLTSGEVLISGGKEKNVFIPKPKNKQGFYKDIAVLAFPALSGSDLITEWRAKANFIGGGDEAHRTLNISQDSIIDPNLILDLTSNLDKNSILNWEAPEGDWLVLRIGYTPTGTLNRSAPEGGEGLEIDKFSKEAMDFHFKSMMESLMKTMSSLSKKGKIYIEIDSWEVGMQNWTPNFSEEFKKRTGYNLIKYLPTLTGRIVGSPEESDRFLWDFRRVQADLVADNYYGHFNTLCKEHDMFSYNEPYPPGPFEEYQISSRVDASMGEFWTGLSSWFQHNYKHRRSIKLCASVAHAFGRKIVGAEAFTAESPSGKWQTFPFHLKALGDRYFTEGLTRIVFHRFAHQPHPDPSVVPGMTMSYWGMHFERTNTWWDKGKAWLDYLARCQFMLQQGLFIADIAYFTGEGAPKLTKTFREDLYPIPPEGYDYDVVNKEVIFKRMAIKNGKIVLPDGMSYKILSTQNNEVMTLELVEKLHEMVSQGMVLVGKKPKCTPGLGVNTGNDAKMQKIVDNLWGELDGVNKTHRYFGKGQVFWEDSLQNIFNSLDIIPDFTFSSKSGDAPIRYIHRKIDNTEVYFIANDRRSYEELICTFRVDGRVPELWDPVTGEKNKLNIYNTESGRTNVPVQLAPYGSTFIIFKKETTNKNIKEVQLDDKVIINTKNFPVSRQISYPDIKDNFTICFWAKPEIDIMLNSGFEGWFFGDFREFTDYYAIYPTSGFDIYGEGHETCGLTVGRNGIAIWHRDKTKWPFIKMIAPAKIEGWTHIAIVYRNRKPSVFLNEQRIKSQLKNSERKSQIVHPGIGRAYLTDGATYYNGDMSQPEVFAEAWDEKQINEAVKKQNYKKELKKHNYTFSSDEKGNPGILVWKNGTYKLKSNGNQFNTLKITELDKPTKLTGEWNVNFPPKSGAPNNIVFPELISFHKHNNESVKFFSGTATYSKTFIINQDTIEKNNRIFLDLGHVEILAEVHLNNINMGTLWTRPYQLEISKVVKAGENQLIVKVVNLLPNRLIGDEHLPVEYEFEKPSFDMGACIKKIPSWYINGEPKPNGQRITFSTWQHYQKDHPLLESGLIGPVVIRFARFITSE